MIDIRRVVAGTAVIAAFTSAAPRTADDCGYDLVVLRSPGCESSGGYGLIPWGMNNHGAVAGSRLCLNYSNFLWPGIGDDLIYLQAPGDHPSLANLDDGDLRFNVDFRSVYAAVLGDWLKTDADAVLGKRWRPAQVLRA